MKGNIMNFLAADISETHNKWETKKGRKSPVIDNARYWIFKKNIFKRGDGPTQD